MTSHLTLKKPKNITKINNVKVDSTANIFGRHTTTHSIIKITKYKV